MREHDRRARDGRSRSKPKRTGHGGPVAGTPLARRGVRGAGDSARRGAAARLTRVTPADARAGVAPARRQGRQREGAVGRGRSERDSLATELAARTVVRMRLPCRTPGRRERRSPRLGRGFAIDDPRRRSILEPTQQVVTRCLQQQGQGEQEVECERAAGSVNHEVDRSVDGGRLPGWQAHQMIIHYHLTRPICQGCTKPLRMMTALDEDRLHLAIRSPAGISATESARARRPNFQPMTCLQGIDQDGSWEPDPAEAGLKVRMPVTR